MPHLYLSRAMYYQNSAAKVILNIEDMICRELQMCDTRTPVQRALALLDETPEDYQEFDFLSRYFYAHNNASFEIYYSIDPAYLEIVQVGALAKKGMDVHVIYAERMPHWNGKGKKPSYGAARGDELIRMQQLYERTLEQRMRKAGCWPPR